MDFQDVVRRRHMVRTFTRQPVPQASVDRILGNAVRGPSAGFSQGQAFLVLSGEIGILVSAALPKNSHRRHDSLHDDCPSGNQGEIE